MVFDVDTGKLLGEVGDVSGAHGVAVVPELNKGYATAGKDGAVIVFDLKTLKTLHKIVQVGEKPDAILYDGVSRKIFAFNHGSGDVFVEEPAAPPDKRMLRPREPLVVGGVLEFGVTDGAGRVFVNVEDKNEVVEIDSRQEKVTARWPVAPGEGPTGLAIDPAHHRLFVGCSNQKMVILDAEKGTVLATVPVGNGVDGVAYDSHLGLVVTSNGRDGTLTAVREAPDGRFAVVQTLTTIKGARTIADDPKAHRFYLPCLLPHENEKPSFGLLVVGSAAEK
jgi:DNA-binding beta-propeller fold protein YncE